MRRSAVLEVSDLAKRLYTAGIQSIIFAKSRVRVEMIVTYLKELTRNKLLDESVRGYRGGIYHLSDVSSKKACVMGRFKQ